MARQPSAITYALAQAHALRSHVDGVLAVSIDAAPVALAGVTLPYDGFLLTVRLPHPSAAAADAPRGGSWLSPLRSRPGRWQACADGCLTLMAMLRPGAALALMREQRFGEIALDAVPLAQLTGPAATARLEAAVDAACGIDAKLLALASWVESETVVPLQRDATLRRLAHAAAALNAHASVPVAEVAGMLGVHRRRLEREFSRWFGASPKQVQLAARLQQIARLAWHGSAPAAIAADLGLVDPSHLAHTVRDLTGMTFTRFARTAVLPPLAQGFRAATAGAHLFA